MAHAGQKLLPQGGKDGGPPLPPEQLRPQFLLKLGHGMAQTGLGDAQPPGRLGITPRAAELHKIAQMDEIHMPSSIL